MAIRIPTNQVVNLQQIEAVVAGPDGANRLFAVTGQLDATVNVFSSGSQTQTFTVLLGPVLTRQQFFRAICTASVAKTSFRVQTPPGEYSFGVSSSDADWDGLQFIILKGLRKLGTSTCPQCSFPMRLRHGSGTSYLM